MRLHAVVHVVQVPFAVADAPGLVVSLGLSLRILESVKNAAGNAQKRNTKHKRQKTEGG